MRVDVAVTHAHSPGSVLFRRYPRPQNLRTGYELCAKYRTQLEEPLYILFQILAPCKRYCTQLVLKGWGVSCQDLVYDEVFVAQVVIKPGKCVQVLFH